MFENSAGEDFTTNEGSAAPTRMHMRAQHNKNIRSRDFSTSIEKYEKNFLANFIISGERGIKSPAITKRSLFPKYPVWMNRR